MTSTGDGAGAGWRPVSPERTRAVLVGVEQYAAGPSWSLNGPASDACRFANWMLDRGVPASQIHLMVSPLEHGEALAEYGLQVRPADRNTVVGVLGKQARETATDELLFVYWGGHGVVEGDDSRRVFLADADADAKHNLNLDAYLRSMRTDYYPQRQQVVVVDACQTFVEELRSATTLPAEEPPCGARRLDRLQLVLFAASPGEIAKNENARGTGVFSEAVLAELRSAPPDRWPPDFTAVLDAVKRRFAALRGDGTVRQRPTYQWYRGPDGDEDRVGVPESAGKQPQTPGPGGREPQMPGPVADRPRDLGMVLEDLARLIDELATLYKTLDSASLLLDRIGYPEAQRPSFTNLARDEWSAILRRIRHGISRGGFFELLDAALREYQNNPTFRDLAGRYGVPIPPPSP